MKRYFVACDSDMPCPVAFNGAWHSIELASHGDCGTGHHLICLVDEHIPAPKGWTALPPIYDAQTTLRASVVDQDLLKDIGVTGDETTLKTAIKLNEIHPMMGL